MDLNLGYKRVDSLKLIRLTYNRSAEVANGCASVLSRNHLRNDVFVLVGWILNAFFVASC